MDNCTPSILLATERLSEKARELLKTGLDVEPVLDIRKEIFHRGREQVGKFKLEELGSAGNGGGMMLYTSGTTNRPVRYRLLRSVSYPTNSL